MLVTPDQAKPLIIKCMKARLPVVIVGSPGTSKSSCVEAIAAEMNLEYRPIYLATLNILALAGYPTLINDRAEFVPFDLFPLEGDEPAEGKRGFLVNLEELMSIDKEKQIAAYAILLERKIGNHKLHKNCFVMGTGNLSSDKAGVKPISTAMQSRMAHLEMHLPTEDWLKYAYSAGVSSMITSFLEWRPSMLNNFDPKHSDKTFACARTWSFLDSVLGKPSEVGAMRALIDGIVGMSASNEFISFTKFYSKIPKITDIIKDPMNAPLVTDGLAYALTGSIADAMSLKTVKKLCKYIERMDMDMQVVVIRRTIAVHPDLLDVPEVDDLADKLASKL